MHDDTNSITNATPPARVGRKTRYSAALIGRLCGYIADGLNISQACAACSVGVSTLRDWRKEYEGLEEKLEAAREVMRAKVLAEIKAAGAKDWRAHEAFLRLAFAEYRFPNSPQVNIALQNNLSLEERDPERARLLAQLEASRARALADKGAAIDGQLVETPDARRAEALSAERKLRERQSAKPLALPAPEPTTPKRMTIVERAETQEERMRAEGWKSAHRDEIDDLLGD